MVWAKACNTSHVPFHAVLYWVLRNMRKSLPFGRELDYISLLLRFCVKRWSTVKAGDQNGYMSSWVQIPFQISLNTVRSSAHKKIQSGGSQKTFREF